MDGCEGVGAPDTLLSWVSGVGADALANAILIQPFASKQDTHRILAYQAIMSAHRKPRPNHAHHGQRSK